MEILVTGSNGFVAKHLIAALQARGDQVIGIDLAENPANQVTRYHRLDLSNGAELRQILETERPQAIVHLAATSSVALSWENPSLALGNNINSFINLVETIRTTGLKTRLLTIGSSEEYGYGATAEMPISEECRLNPSSPYAAAKAAQELIAKQYVAGYALDIMMTRSFNQFGPGQRPVFAISNFIGQFLAAKRSGQSRVTLKCGNIDVIRDFLDVRDAAAAYMAILENGHPGETYNVCSGNGHTLREIIGIIADILKMQVDIAIDPSRLRPTDPPVIIGCNAKIKSAARWSPSHELIDSIRDTISAYEY